MKYLANILDKIIETETKLQLQWASLSDQADMAETKINSGETKWKNAICELRESDIVKKWQCVAHW